MCCIFNLHPHHHHSSVQILFFFFCGVAVSFFIIISGISLETTFSSFPQAWGVQAELTNLRNTLRRSAAPLPCCLATLGSVCGSHSPRNHSKLQWSRVALQQRKPTRLTSFPTVHESKTQHLLQSLLQSFYSWATCVTSQTVAYGRRWPYLFLSLMLREANHWLPKVH